MRLTTWNVNGIRNPFGYHPWSLDRTFPAMFDILESDIVVMQELKIQRKDLRDDMVLIDGWDCYFSLPKQKKGYSGVAIYTRNATCSPIRAEEGILGVLSPPNSTTAYRDLPESQHIGGYPSEFQIANIGVDPVLLDSEGRCVCLEFPAFVLFGVYSPANSNGLRDDFRYGFLCALECRIRNLIKMGKRVVLVGDLNVSRTVIDTAGATEEVRKTGMTIEEYVSTPNRRVFNQLLVGGEVVGERDEGREHPVLMDVVRDFHPDRKGMYTHWEQKVNARPGNFGSRIDFVLASTKMKGWFSNANIQEGLMGSDHCPVYADFNDIVQLQGESDSRDVYLVDIMNPSGVFQEGARQKPWDVKDVPPFSAKLMPEFYQRRSIKDMFKKPSAIRPASSSQAPSLSMAEQQQKSVAIPPTDPVSDTAALTTGVLQTASSDPNLIAASPERKRKASDTPAPKPEKKQKPAASATAKTSQAKGQQSLKGFFQPKASTKSAAPFSQKGSETAGLTADNGTPGNDEGSLYQAMPAADGGSTKMSVLSGRNAEGRATQSSTRSDNDQTQSQAGSPPPASSTNTGPAGIDDSDEYVHDPIVSKESWQSLFRKKATPPRCEDHKESCMRMQTKKKGENQGRSFWMCARPLGPSGTKEKATQWRCKTFIWCSDWKGDG